MLIRPVEPGDKTALAAFVAHLSAQSRDERWGSPIADPLLPDDIIRSGSAIGAVALVAVTPSDGRIVGLASYQRMAHDAAQVALVVADDLRRRRRCGVGADLVARLTDYAARAGIREFSVTTRNDGAAARTVRALASRFGAPIQEERVTGAHGTLEAIIGIPKDWTRRNEPEPVR